MRKVLFLINPVAGHGNASTMIEKIQHRFQNSMILPKIVVSSRKGEIGELAKKYQNQGYNDFIVVGGDGSLGELVTGLDLSNQVNCGVIPYGTGNDFIRSLTNPSIDEIFNAIERNTTIPIDIGEINGTRFVNTCSFGVDSLMGSYIDKIKNIFSGKAVYLISAIIAGLTYKPYNSRITIDDKVINTKLTLLCVGNGKFFGGGMEICPDAILNDGYFDVCLISGISNLKFLLNFKKVYSGKLKTVKEVKYFKAKKIKIETEPNCLTNSDGNYHSISPVEINIIENAINVFMKGC